MNRTGFFWGDEEVGVGVLVDVYSFDERVNLIIVSGKIVAKGSIKN